MNLESRIDKLKDNLAETAVRLAENKIYKWAVDVGSGWLYYTPTYGIQEIVAQEIANQHVNMHKVYLTRLIGLGVGAAVMRPVGRLRNYVAKKYNVTKDSSFKDKLKVNLIAITPIQSATYSLMLFGGMAWSGNWDWKAYGIALSAGIFFSALHSFPYGVVQDKTRKFCGIKPAIGNEEVQKTELNKSIKSVDKKPYIIDVQKKGQTYK